MSHTGCECICAGVITSCSSLLCTPKHAGKPVHRHCANMALPPACYCRRHVACVHTMSHKRPYSLCWHMACAESYYFVPSIITWQLLPLSCALIGHCQVACTDKKFIYNPQTPCAGAWCGRHWSRAVGRCRTAWRHLWMQRGWSSTAPTATTRCAASANRVLVCRKAWQCRSMERPPALTISGYSRCRCSAHFGG